MEAEGGTEEASVWSPVKVSILSPISVTTPSLKQKEGLMEKEATARENRVKI